MILALRSANSIENVRFGSKGEILLVECEFNGATLAGAEAKAFEPAQSD